MPQQFLFIVPKFQRVLENLRNRLENLSTALGNYRTLELVQSPVEANIYERTFIPGDH